MFWLVTVGVLATAAYVTYSRWNSLQVYAYALDAASWAAKWACSRVDNVKMLEVVFANGWMTSVLPNPVVDAEHTFMEMILKNFGSVGYPVTSVRLVVDVANEEHVLRFDHGQLQQKVSDVIGGIRKIAEDPEAALMTLEQHPVSATLKLVNGAEHNVTMAITKMLPGPKSRWYDDVHVHTASEVLREAMRGLDCNDGIDSLVIDYAMPGLQTVVTPLMALNRSVVKPVFID